jgi:hypothetical protein
MPYGRTRTVEMHADTMAAAPALVHYDVRRFGCRRPRGAAGFALGVASRWKDETPAGAGVSLAKQYKAQGLDMMVDHAQFDDGEDQPTPALSHWKGCEWGRTLPPNLALLFTSI